MSGVVTEVLAGGTQFAIPVLTAASGELISQRAGVLNLSLDGMILTGAFAGALTSQLSGSAVAGVLGAVAAALVFGALQAVLSVTLRANQLVTGIAANALALGATSYGARLVFDDGTTAHVPGFSQAGIPWLRDLPIVGRALFAHSAVEYLGLALAIAAVLVTSRRRSLGLVVDAVGENAAVADHAGVRVNLVRYAAVLTTAALAGIAGAELSLADLQGFTENMTNGIGYIAVAAVIAGSWKQGRLAVACLVFGIAQALQFTAPAIGLTVPVAVLVMLPYLIALLAISGLVGRSRGPGELTMPFVRKG